MDRITHKIIDKNSYTQVNSYTEQSYTLYISIVCIHAVKDRIFVFLLSVDKYTFDQCTSLIKS